ncbi:MAG: hypothetical protein LBR42_02535 [Candidatus Methanoplasma sp.]|jgi:hypothetical protein|nr:hypothetical protein [Candidatus Methanoplasma sp.]
MKTFVKPVLLVVVVAISFLSIGTYININDTYEGYDLDDLEIKEGQIFKLKSVDPEHDYSLEIRVDSVEDGIVTYTLVGDDEQEKKDVATFKKELCYNPISAIKELGVGDFVRSFETRINVPIGTYDVTCTEYKLEQSENIEFTTYVYSYNDTSIKYERTFDGIPLSSFELESIQEAG